MKGKGESYHGRRMIDILCCKYTKGRYRLLSAAKPVQSPSDEQYSKDDNYQWPELKTFRQ